MKKIYIYLIIISLAFFSTLPILNKSNIYGHDSKFHIACISDIKENISLANPFPKLNHNSDIDLGYGTHLFYPPLPHYIGAYTLLLLENFGFSVFDTLAFIYLTISILSGIAMYHLTYSISKNKLVSLLSSAIYLLMPYRMGDMIVRSAMNEVFVFLFIPLILLSLNRLLENKKFLSLFVIGYSGLIFSHLVLALYTSIFLIFWGCFNFKKLLKIEILKKLLLGILIVSIIVLPFISLMISQKYGGNYLVFKEFYMSGLHYVMHYNTPLEDFIIPKDDYSWDVPFFINGIVLISLAISITSIIKHKKLNTNIFYYIFLLFLCFVMCLKGFPWIKLPEFLYMIQFPWRLQTFIAISLSILAPLWFGEFEIKFKNVISIVLIIILIISELHFLKSLSTYKHLITTLDYAPGMGNMNEYLPNNTYYNMDYFNQRENQIIYDGFYHTESKIYENSNKLIFQINNINNDTKVELPRLYYVGYKLTNSKNEDIDFYENKYGFIEFIGNNDTYTLEFIGPLIYRIFIIIRYIAFFCLLFYFLFKKIKNPIKI